MNPLTVPAWSFVQSIGINIHLHYTGTVYENHTLIEQRLKELGIRHIRDGLLETTWAPYYAAHERLGKVGIKGLYMVDLAESEAEVDGFMAKVPTALEAMECTNELDNPGMPKYDANWPTKLPDLLGMLSPFRRAGIPLVGPSLIEPFNYDKVGDISEFIDYGNTHNYFGGRHPGTPGWGVAPFENYGSIGFNLERVRKTCGLKPVWSTENGYKDRLDFDAIPPETAAKYLPRMLMEHYRAGIPRTYIYELADNSASGGMYGLLDENGEKKPAFHAVKNLIGLVADAKAPILREPLDYVIGSTNLDIHHMAIMKRDAYLLAIWLEKSAHDIQGQKPVYVPVETVPVSVSGQLFVRMNQWQLDGTVKQTELEGRELEIPVSDSITVLELES